MGLDEVGVELPAESWSAPSSSIPSTSGGRFATRFHQIGSRSGWKHSTNVPCGIEARRWLATCGSSWCAIRTSKASAIAATRRHSVGPPDHEASKLQTSIAPVDHQVAAAGGRELALSGADRTLAESGRRASRGGRCPTGTAPRTSTRSQSSTSRAKRIASCSVQPWFASAARTKSSPAACARETERAPRPRSGVEPADLELHPGEPELAELGRPRPRCPRRRRSSHRSRSSAARVR